MDTLPVKDEAATARSMLCTLMAESQTLHGAEDRVARAGFEPDRPILGLAAGLERV